MMLTPGVRSNRTLTPLEIAGGMVYGLDEAVGRLPPDPEISDPRLALEEVVRKALEAPPCVVSFSGGRDSSALLALATNVARRHGYPLPIPVTLDFRHDEAANEESWQMPVISRLNLPDWVRLDARLLDLDAVGTVAQGVLRRHGLRWPFNSHFHMPMIDVAAGGTLITGFGGDELGNSSASATAEQAILRTRRLRKSDVLSVGLAVAPWPVRAAVYRHRCARDLLDYPWLTREATRRLAWDWGRDSATVGFGWPKAIERLWRGRYFSLCRESFDLMGTDRGVSVYHPFVDPAVLAAFRATGPFAGYGSRQSLLQTLFGSALPPEVSRRTDKAGFTNPLWTDEARAFAGVCEIPATTGGLVDAQGLRNSWLSPAGDARVTLLLQDAWLQSGSAAG